MVVVFSALGEAPDFGARPSDRPTARIEGIWPARQFEGPFGKTSCYNTHMSTPISALQRNASRVVRRVAASGVAEEITDRGRVVAILGPPPRTEGLERLRQAGAVRPAKPGRLSEVIKEFGRLPDLGLTEALQEQRDTER